MQQSPFENIFNIIGGLSEGNEKPMKHGFYNAFALFILAICCVAVYVLFLILEPFFKPLFWALLVGSLLHPFKYKLSKKLKSWFEDLEKTNTSVVFGLMVIPVNIVNFASDTVGQQFIDHYKTVIGLLSAIFVVPWLYNSVPRSLGCLFWQLSSFVSFSTTLLISVCSSYITLTIFLAYVISIYILWTPQRATMFRVTSQLMWLVISSFLASLTGSLQVYTFVLLQAICITGFALEVLDVHRKLLARDPEASLLLALHKAIINEHIVENPTEEKPPEVAQTESSDQETTPEKDSPSPVTPESLVKRGSWAPSEGMQSSPRHAKILYKTRTLSALPLSNNKLKAETRFLAAFKQRSLDENYMKNNFDNDEETALYFKLLFFSCLCMLVWKHIWLLPVTLFFLAIHVLKRLLNYFGVWLFFENQYNNVMGRVKDWWRLRQSALIPAHVRGIGKMLSICNASTREVAYSSVDTVSTCIVIVGLILFLTVATVFICIQIYSEAIVVVQLSGSLLNSTYVQNSELHAYLPEGWEEKLDSLIDNAYTYGREGISTAVKSILKEGDPEKINRVEQQILELWDRVYQSWVSGHFGSTMGPQVDSSAIQDSWDNFVNDVSNAPGMFDYSGVVEWVKANVGTLSAIATSIWAPLASNVSLLAGSVGALTSLLLCGGSALINMFINLVVFFTTLFYLLASSNALYKPVEVITQVQPNFGPRLGIALSVAINQVFRASFKMALFYGLWTWLVHNLFGAKVVYLPSVLAAVLGAAPFLGPYLAGIPAALDVWLQGRPMAALLLPIAQAAPIAFLDAAVYAEIKDGGHPYVTGLAIAGGIFYLGPEGAILGPLLLCCLMVVLNLSSTFLRDTPSEERAALHSRVRDSGQKPKNNQNPTKPIRPMSAYMMWLMSGARDRIRAEYPGMKVTEVAKKGGELWLAMSKDDKIEWEEKSAKAQEQYDKDLEAYNAYIAEGSKAK